MVSNVVVLQRNDIARMLRYTEVASVTKEAIEAYISGVDAQGLAKIIVAQARYWTECGLPDAPTLELTQEQFNCWHGLLYLCGK